MYKASIDADNAIEGTAAPGVFVALLLFSLCLMRPTLFGQDYTVVGGFGVIVTTMAYLLTRSGARVVVGRASAELNVTVAFLAFWSYVFGMSVFSGSSTLPFLFKSTAAGLCVPICLLLLSSNGNLVARSFSSFAKINSVIGYSIAITVCLLPIVGYAGLRMFAYTISGYQHDEGGNGDVLFPFSVVYGNLIEYGIYRFCGIYREAGIAQAFFTWSFIFLMYSRARFVWILGPLLGALLCGSTAVAFSFAAAAFVHFGSRPLHRPRGLLILLLLLGVLTLLLVFAPGLGLLDKAATHASSLTDRSQAMAMALPRGDILQWLVGHGLYYENTENVENTGINAISAVFEIGVVGFVLYMGTFFAGAMGSRSYAQACRYLTLISPFLVTSLFFQPIIDAPLVVSVLFAMPPAARAS